MSATDVSEIASAVLRAFPDNPQAGMTSVMVEVIRRVVERDVAAYRSAVEQRPRVERVIEVVCIRTGISRQELLKKRRVSRIAQARGITCVAIRFALNMSYSEAGEYLGLDHTTVMHHCRKYVRGEPQYALANEVIDQLRSEWSAEAEAAE